MWKQKLYFRYHYGTGSSVTETKSKQKKLVDLILKHADPLLGNDCEISNYTTAIAK
jgi:hypothetical protein